MASLANSCRADFLTVLDWEDPSVCKGTGPTKTIDCFLELGAKKGPKFFCGHYDTCELEGGREHIDIMFSNIKNATSASGDPARGLLDCDPAIPESIPMSSNVPMVLSVFNKANKAKKISFSMEAAT
jgi:hypothetical protein